MKLQLKRSNVLTSGAAKVPTASQLEYGELAINYNNSDPAIFLKDSNNNVIRISGVGNIADDGQVELPASTTPPNNPEAGNLWFNSDEGRLYIYYVDANTSQWVDASPDSYDPSVVPDMSNPDYQAGTLDDRYNSSQVGTTAPAVTTRQEGALWWNSSANEGKLYVLYNDPAPDGRKKWVEASPYPDTTGFIKSNDNGTQQNIIGGGGLTVAGNVGIGTTTPASLLQISPGAVGSQNAILMGYGRSANPTDAVHKINWTSDQLIIGADSANTIDSQILFYNDGTEKIRIDSSGNLIAYSGSTDGNYFAIRGKHSPGNDYNRSEVRFGVENNSNGLGFLAFATGNNTASERMRITSDGKIGIGTTSVDANLHIKGGYPTVHIERDHATNYSRLLLDNTSNDGGAIDGIGDGTGGLRISTSAAGTITERMRIDSSGNVALTSTSASATQQILFSDATSGRGKIVYRHNGDSLAFETFSSERMRIDSSGNVLIGKTSSASATQGINLEGSAGFGGFTRNSGAGLLVNRQSDDGTLVNFLQADNVEGTISVSGSTVSYNGAHLARWSQLPGGVERTEILRGSVLSNLDEMCEWGEEDNEQLNRMQVSTVEGDKNVSGVFQAWDDDDDTYVNDFYCAMTGDFVIRIAQGTTVARGDLLMSAGDGTAKPQDDDIVRSKTIAKVTSTTVSTTYSDNSYCVPCVLMAC